jgi:TonB family protein
MQKVWIFLSIMAFSAVPASATDSDNEEQLRKTYVGTQQMLRHFYASGTLKFDVNGNPTNKEKEGPWTLLGGVLIDNLKLKPGKLELHGHRRMLVIDDQNKTLRSIKLDEKFSIEINSRPGPDQSEQLKDALSRVFVSIDDLLSVAPDYWRDYLARFSGKATQGAPCEDSTAKIVDSGSENATSGKVSAGIVGGLKVHDVMPNYLPIARENNVQGELALRAVIDKTGSVSRLCITQALGAGLDDMMVNTVQQWKYRPYTLNGQPIEVQTTVKTRFGMR